MQSQTEDPPSTDDPAHPNQQPPTSEPAERTPKRQRQLSPSHESLAALAAAGESSSAGHAPSSSNKRTLKQPPTHGSSLDTPDAMHHSTTPPDASSSGIKYTRTGRVSKATKGQRVHHCDECGKTYTRAEHLRRHQQNHKPGAFPCDFPGCGRSFYREDLLTRHRARHNDPLNPPSRRHSIGSQSSAPDAGLPPPPPPPPPPPSGLLPAAPTSQPPFIPPPEPQRQSASGNEPSQSTGPSRTPPKRPIAPNELQRGIGPIPLMVNEPYSLGVPVFGNPWEPSSSSSHSPYYDLDGDESDEWSGAPYFPPRVPRARYFSDASLLGYDQPLQGTSRSPMSADSSAVHQPWSAQRAYEAPVTSSPFVYSGGQSRLQDVSAFPYGGQRLFSPATRDYMEQGELDILNVGRQASIDDTLDAHSMPDHARYLDAYWTWVHELYPVVHRSTYDHDTASALLRAAMIALGAQATGERDDLSTARMLHDKCVKVLKKRSMQDTHTYDVCDMQAIVLVEVYSVFKSRRPPLQFSKHFDTVCGILVNDPSTTVSSPSGTPTNRNNFGMDATNGSLANACKQRLLLTCYALEQQHKNLFGRPAATDFACLGRNLPFPISQERWDTSLDSLDHPRETTSFERVSEALKAVPYMTEPADEAYDAFRSMLMLAHLSDPSSDMLDWADSRDDYSLLLQIERTPRTRLAFHTFMLCRSTPVREVLAVAGESWVMAEKLATEKEYTAAQVEVREWVSSSRSSDNFGYELQGKSVHVALEHALHILEIHQESPRTRLLFQEWAVYLAAVVIWVRGYALRAQSHDGRLSLPSPTEPRLSPSQLDQAVTFLTSSGPAAITGWTEARNALQWTKATIERVNVPHTCGLTSSALDVLDKLVTRGNENGWF